ncbi:MAG TPA: ribosomal protein S18-alanine N-acetyltransferase [Candidatus Angelobacter sp.]|nr:ribosomal protein S18-alanine N-acetyltransferase [Candidatus Angelobacter sp.]
MIRVRSARREDVPRMMQVAGHSATAANWNQEAYTGLFSPGAPAGLVTLVIQEDEVVAGFLVGRNVARDEWEIENVAVAGAARRRGLGSRLLGEFMDLARQRGGKHIFLEVRASNRAAQALYQKWAFVEAGTRRSYYQDPVEDALILRFTFPQDGEFAG